MYSWCCLFLLILTLQSCDLTMAMMGEILFWAFEYLPPFLLLWSLPQQLGIFNSSIRKNAEISVLLVRENCLHWRQGNLNRRDNFWFYGCWFFNILERIIPSFCFRLGIKVPFRSFYLSVFPRLHRTLESWTNQNSCHTGSRMLTFRNPDAYTALPVLLN